MEDDVAERFEEGQLPEERGTGREPTEEELARIEGRIKRLSFTDNFVFGEVLEGDLDLCKDVLETVLGIQVDRVELATREKTFEPARDSRAVRLDVYAKDNDGRSFDVEMQRTNAKDLALRARYYQGAMDVAEVGKGCDYQRLNEVYVIFFCTFDPFGHGQKCYSCSFTCDQDAEIDLGYRAKHMFLNATGTLGTVSKELQSLLDYMAGDNETDSELVRRKRAAVGRVLSSPEKIRRYAMYQWTLDDERRAGREEGRAEGRAEAQEKMTRLIRVLAERGRLDELPAAAQDAAKLQALYEEFGIE